MLLSIEKLVYGGDGLARTPADAEGRSMAVFLPFVLPGERVEAEMRQEKPGFARGTATQLFDPSPDRVSASCPYFQQCGGCQYQHIKYEKQLEFKAAILRETLQRIAKLELKAELRVHASPPWNYRNRTRLRVLTTPDFALAYSRFGSHELLSVRECPISSPLINRVMARLLELRGCDCPEGVEELEFFADAADEQLLLWTFSDPQVGENALLTWARTVRNQIPEVVGVAMFASRRASDPDEQAGLRLLTQSGAEEIRYRTLPAEYRGRAGSFFQVNRHLIDDLVSAVTAGAAGEFALDFYAGVGLFSVPLARSFHHIFAVEASQISHADLLHNAPANVKAVRARTEDYLSKPPGRRRPELVVVDPPRSGLGKAVIRGLVELGAPKIRYISCDPATLARDLSPLLAAGYHIEEAHLFDLFPQTFHIESVMLLSR